MPKPTEIVNPSDAEARLRTMFRANGTDGIADADFPRYAAFLALLSDQTRFADALENASKAIWIAYNRIELIDSPNRFTQAICRVGVDLGFAGNDLRVLTAAASPQAFGALLGGKYLWKDSFALGHGEFAHSYQWLAAGIALNWGADTARLYADTKGRLSIMPGWVKDDDSPRLKLRAIRLWEYLADCTQWNTRLTPDLGVAKAWVVNAVKNVCKPAPAPRSTNLWLERLLTGAITVNQLPNMLAIPPSELQRVRTHTPNNVAADQLINDNEELLDLIAEMLVTQFPFWCALSSPVATGGSYRNANNVTALARSKGDWFICAYETRRFEKLLASQNATLIANIRQVVTGGVVIATNFQLTLQSPMNGPLVVTIPGANAGTIFLGNLAQYNTVLGRPETQKAIRDAFWQFVAGGTFQGMSNKKIKDLPHTYQGTILSAMDALAQGRQTHYSSHAKTGQGWTSPTPGIFSRKPSDHGAAKPQLMAEFHGSLGQLTEFAPIWGLWAFK